MGTPNPYIIIVNTILKDKPFGIEELEDFPNKGIGNSQNNKTEYYIEVNGLGRKTFQIFQRSSPKVLGNNGSDSASGLRQDPNEHG